MSPRLNQILFLMSTWWLYGVQQNPLCFIIICFCFWYSFFLLFRNSNCYRLFKCATTTTKTYENICNNSQWIGNIFHQSNNKDCFAFVYYWILNITIKRSIASCFCASVDCEEKKRRTFISYLCLCISIQSSNLYEHRQQFFFLASSNTSNR